MGYKFTDPDEFGQSHLDPASCPTLPDKIGKAAAVGLAGYEIGKMTARRASESKVAGFFKELKHMWDVPDPEQRARENARRRS